MIPTLATVPTCDALASPDSVVDGPAPSAALP